MVKATKLHDKYTSLASRTSAFSYNIGASTGRAQVTQEIWARRIRSTRASCRSSVGTMASSTMAPRPCGGRWGSSFLQASLMELKDETDCLQATDCRLLPMHADDGRRQEVMRLRSPIAHVDGIDCDTYPSSCVQECRQFTHASDLASRDATPRVR